MQEINIEQIMQEIREDIKEKGYKESDLSFHDIPVKTTLTVDEEQYSEHHLREYLQNANLSTAVDYYKPIENKGIKGIVKKIIRKVIKPIVFPLCQEQQKFNSNSIRTMNQMYLYIQLQEKRINELEELITKREK